MPSVISTNYLTRTHTASDTICGAIPYTYTYCIRSHTRCYILNRHAVAARQALPERQGKLANVLGLHSLALQSVQHHEKVCVVKFSGRDVGDTRERGHVLPAELDVVGTAFVADFLGVWVGCVYVRARVKRVTCKCTSIVNSAALWYLLHRGAVERGKLVDREVHVDGPVGFGHKQ